MTEEKTSLDLELHQRYEANRERFMRLEKAMADNIKDLIIRTGISNEDAIQLLRQVEFAFQIKLIFEGKEKAKDTQKQQESPATP